MKKIVNLLLLAVITFFGVVPIGAQERFPKGTAEQWMNIIAMVPRGEGESIVGEAAQEADKLRREIAAKRVEDKTIVAAFLNKRFPGKFVEGIDEYFFCEKPLSDIIAEHKGKKVFFGGTILVKSRKSNCRLQPYLECSINTTERFKCAYAVARGA
jgi:hypothetical protein